MGQGRHEDMSRNVFEENAQIVDAVVYKDGKKHVIGKAHYTSDEDGIQIQLDIDPNADPELVKAFTNSSLDVSIDGHDVLDTTYHRPEGHKPEGSFGFPPPPRPIHEKDN